MPTLLDIRDAGFAGAFAAIVDDRRESDSDVRDTVGSVIADVRRRGDEALLDLTRRFDGFDRSACGLRLAESSLREARAACPAETLAALELAAERIATFHASQKPEDRRQVDALGVVQGYRWRPVDAVGLYVPGGLAAYPSTVLMNALPARVAGVPRIVMTTPMPRGEINPLVLAAAALAGVTEVYAVGGAQAIAALAYGTGSVARVDKIVGPGNAFVAEAKRQVYGVVGIDMVAGPSEILVLADNRAPAAAIAADLLSQAEHDSTAQAILITDDAAYAGSVMAAVSRHLDRLGTATTARASWDRYGVVILVERLEQAVGLIDALAPEHVELVVENPESWLAQLRHAGSVFLGPHTPEAIGDYLGGPNHVLPTGRRARFASGLSVTDFMKRTTFLGCSAESLGVLGPAAIALAEAEGLSAHALSVRVRLEDEYRRG